MTKNAREEATDRPQDARRRWVLPVSVAIVAAYAVFIQWLWGWGALWNAWTDIGISRVSAAIGMLMATYIVRCLRIHNYFPELKGQFLPLLRVTQIHNLVNILLPFRSGEASFPILMRSEFGIPLTRSTAALLWMRALDLHALLAVGAIGLVLASRHPELAVVAWLVFCGLPLAGFLLQKPVERMSMRHAPARWHRRLASAFAGLPTDRAAFFRAWFMTVLNWVIKVVVLAWILSLLGVFPWGGALGGALGGELSSILPVHAPAGVGTYPAGITTGALAFGAERSAGALSDLAKAGVNAHILLLVSAFFATAFSLLLPRSSRKPSLHVS